MSQDLHKSRFSFTLSKILIVTAAEKIAFSAKYKTQIFLVYFFKDLFNIGTLRWPGRLYNQLNLLQVLSIYEKNISKGHFDLCSILRDPQSLKKLKSEF